MTGLFDRKKKRQQVVSQCRWGSWCLSPTLTELSVLRVCVPSYDSLVRGVQGDLPAVHARVWARVSQPLPGLYPLKCTRRSHRNCFQFVHSVRITNPLIYLFSRSTTHMPAFHTDGKRCDCCMLYTWCQFEQVGYKNGFRKEMQYLTNKKNVDITHCPNRHTRWHTSMFLDLACPGMLVVSSSETVPLDQFLKLSQEQHKIQHSGEYTHPRWFIPNTLKYYVLLHDISDGDEQR